MSVAGEMLGLLSDALDVIDALVDRWDPDEFTEEDITLIQQVKDLRESYRNIG